MTAAAAGFVPAQLGESSPPDLLHLTREPLLREICLALRTFLHAQRWFGSKSRTINHVELASSYAFSGGLLCTFSVAFEGGGDSELYQLPLTIATTSEADGLKTTAIIARFSDGAALVDGLYTDAFRAGLLAAVSHGALPDGLDGHATAAGQRVAAADSRISPAEQSNTSIFFAREAVLKIYRRLQPGENPDIELPRFLAEHTTFRHTPAYMGELDEQGTGATLAFLQAFAPNDGDAWAWFATPLTRWLTHAEGEAYTQSLDAAALIGQRTAEMHLALATATDDQDFSAERYTPALLAAAAARIQTQIAASLEALKSRLTLLPPEEQQLAVRVLAMRSGLVKLTHELATGAAARYGERIRVHGDYHLGQLLHSADDFLVVDFEGEPARSLAARRTKDSPLRDVAGMLRSFAYAAAAALRNLPADASAAAAARAQQWLEAAEDTFLASYFSTASEHTQLLPHDGERSTLLRSLTLEKAMYELLYELNNRPDWLSIPLSGILTLLQQNAPDETPAS